MSDSMPFHKALYRSIIVDCTSEPTISELDGGICQLKRNVAVFSIGRPSGYTPNVIMCSKQKT